MNRSMKAALLSGLVFPGAGHLYLKRVAAGLLLAASTAVAIYFFISGAVETALAVSEEIQRGGVSLEADAIAQLIAQRAHGTETTTDIPGMALVLLWLIGIVDSVRIGRLQDREEKVEGET